MLASRGYQHILLMYMYTKDTRDKKGVFLTVGPRRWRGVTSIDDVRIWASFTRSRKLIIPFQGKTLTEHHFAFTTDF